MEDPSRDGREREGRIIFAKVIESLKGIFLACFKPVNRKRGASWVAWRVGMHPCHAEGSATLAVVDKPERA